MVELRIRRDGDFAMIEYEALPGITVALHLGSGGARTLSDREILERHHRRVTQLAELLVDAPQVDWDEAVITLDEDPAAFHEVTELLAARGAGVCLILLDE